MLTLVPIWAVMGLSWNLFSGYGGLTSFGHASFFGVGAYTVTLALVYWSLTPWLGIPLGMLMGAIAAFLIGTPTFRLRGHYFALSMLAYPLAIMYIMEYLGFQEVSLPMHASIRWPVSAIHRSAALHRAGAGDAGARAAGVDHGGEFALRPGTAGDHGRTSWPPRPPASTRGPGRCAR